MIFKFIVLAAIGIFVYKLFGGQLPSLRKKQMAPKAKKQDSDTLVECSKCGTYVSVEETTLIHGKYYCDECA